MVAWFFIDVLLIVAALSRLRRAKKNRPSLPDPEPIILEWAPVEDAPDGTELSLSVPFCEEPDEPEEDSAVLLARADIDRYEATKGVYLDLLDALEEEIQVIEQELKSPETTDKRRTTLAHRMTTIKGRIATTTSKLYSIDRKIEMAYQIAVV